jgi:hypothetical protein
MGTQARPSEGPDLVLLGDEGAAAEVISRAVLGLWEVVNDLARLRPTRRSRYRVTVFGSARVDPDHWAYALVRDLAAELTRLGCDIVTGGGPGLMQAANEGPGWPGRTPAGRPSASASSCPSSRTSTRSSARSFMDRTEVLQRFERLNVWKQGDQRAPHKPLLVLYALGRWQRGRPEVSFAEAEPELTALLQEFGPPRRSDHPEQPFWRLQNDGVWAVHAPHDLPLKTGDTIPKKAALRSHEVRAGFTPEVRAALAADPGLVAAIARRVLDGHFPESLHQDVLDAVGLTLDGPTARSVSTRR